jgi:hypothetical protein
MSPRRPRRVVDGVRTSVSMGVPSRPTRQRRPDRGPTDFGSSSGRCAHSRHLTGHPRGRGLPGRPGPVLLGRVTLPDTTPDLLKLIPEEMGTPAYDSSGKVRDGAWVAELTGLLDLARNMWPAGQRVIVRKERPHAGAQLRITDVDGHRVTAFAPTPPPAVPAPNCPIWSSGTDAGPAERTASGARKTPAWPTCPCTTWTRTGSGAPSSRWPARSPPGCRPSP